MTEALVRTGRQDRVATVTLNRPARHNALVPELLSDLLEALDECTADGAAAMVLAAQGPSFSTGGDLLGFFEHRDAIGEYAERLVGLLNETILTIRRLPLVTVCAVEGQVSGGALGLLLSCDRVVMSRRASVTPWYRAVGFSPDGGWQALLPQVIGAAQAARWLRHDLREDAARCLELGLAHEVVVSDAAAAALTWAHAAAAGDPADREHRIARRKRGNDGLARRLAAEQKAFVEQARSAEALRGIERYLGGKVRAVKP